jgi:hypothetical protein
MSGPFRGLNPGADGEGNTKKEDEEKGIKDVRAWIRYQDAQEEVFQPTVMRTSAC